MAERNRRSVNIGEVARAAGVSKMTVSRMLNQSCKVAPATRQRVQKVMDELRYRPSLLARGLASRKTRILGLMIFDQLNLDFLQPIFLGVEHEARQSGYDLLIFSRPGGKEGRENRCLGLVDGVLCLGYEMDNRAVEGLEERGIPCVVIGRREWRRASPRSVCPDYFNAYRDLTRRLLGLGHRNFAFMGGSGDFYVDREKRGGYRAALEEAGLPRERALVFDDGEAARVRELLEEYRPTAVILENTIFPLPLLLSVRELGWKIPRDLSLVYTRRDFIDIHTLYDLTGLHELSLISVPRRELGEAGVRLLHRLIGGERELPREEVMALEFIPGESCGPPPGGAGRDRGTGKEKP